MHYMRNIDRSGIDHAFCSDNLLEPAGLGKQAERDSIPMPQVMLDE